MIDFLYKLDYSDLKWQSSIDSGSADSLHERNTAGGPTEAVDPKSLSKDHPHDGHETHEQATNDLHPPNDVQAPDDMQTPNDGVLVPDLLVNVHMYAMGDNYAIEGLKDLAKAKFSTRVEKAWDTIDFPLAIPLVYTTTPDHDRGLQDAVTENAQNHLHVLKHGVRFMKALQGTQGFAFDMIKAGLREGEPEKGLYCLVWLPARTKY
ncbi:MAG: hypothetical protein M1833_003175 [Piccolia ochrophora]|nr:MAG: hypothetical protein M1833_003175 [Piccolia ochrophora]